MSKSKKNVINPPLHSVFTGAWTPGFVDVHGETLHNLGVYKEKKDVLMENAYEAENRPRMAENWREAPSHYSGGGESGGARQKYIIKISRITICYTIFVSNYYW